MAITGYPDLLSFRQRIQTNQVIKTRLNEVSQEAITGRSSDIVKATKGRVGGAYLMEKAINDIEQETRINSVSRVRLDLMTQGLEGARNAIDGIDTRGLLALRSGNETEVRTITEEAEANLRSVMTALDAKHGSRSLFSGNATDTNAFSGPDALLDAVRNIVATAGTPDDVRDALDTFFNDPTGGFETSIYTGGDEAAPPVRIGNDERIEVNIRGDNQAIKDTLRGLAVMATAFSSVEDFGTAEFEEIYSGGLEYSAQGAFGLIELQAETGIYGSALNKADARNQAETLVLSTAYQAIVGVDQFDAAAELQQLQVQLESSYLLTNRLSQLSLSNYLR